MNINFLMDSEWSQAITMTILHSFWQGVLIVLLISIIIQTNKKRSVEELYAIHFSGLTLLFFASFFTFFYYLGNQQMGSFGSGTMAGLPEHSTRIGGEYAGSFFSWKSTVSSLWFAGAFCFFLKSLLSTFNLYKTKMDARPAETQWIDILEEMRERMGIHRAVQLLSSSQLHVPLAMGVIRPTIIFPTSFFTHLSPEQIESILMHELVHVKRFDFLFNLFQCGVEAVLFFNPASWWLNHYIRKYREYHCDDLVQKHLNDKKSYLEALYKVASYSLQPSKVAPTLFNNKSILLMRVKRMLDTPTRDFQIRPIIGLFVGLMILLVSYSFTLNQHSVSTESDGLSALERELASMQAEVEELYEEIDPAELEIASLVHLIDEPRAEGYSEPIRLSQLEPIIVNQLEPNPKPKAAALLNEKLMYKLLPKSSPALATKVNKNLKVFVAQDTIVKNKRILELEREIEMKSEEIEALAEKLSEEIEANVEAQAERIEKLAEELEEKLEPRMEELEMSAIDEEKLEKIEALAEELGERIESEMEALEEQLENEEFREFESQIEELAGRIEELHEEDKDGNKEEIDRLKAEIKAVSKKMKEHMKGFKMKHHEIMNDPEVKRIKEEMKAMEKEMRKSRKEYKHDDIYDDETRAIKKEIDQLQKEIKENVKNMSGELKEKIHAKSKEIEALARELKQEYKKLEKEQKGEN